MTAKEYQIFFLCIFFCQLLRKWFSLRCHKQHTRLFSNALCQILPGIVHWHRLHYHSSAAAIWIIIDTVMFICGIVTYIDSLH